MRAEFMNELHSGGSRRSGAVGQWTGSHERASRSMCHCAASAAHTATTTTTSAPFARSRRIIMLPFTHFIPRLKLIIKMTCGFHKSSIRIQIYVYMFTYARARTGCLLSARTLARTETSSVRCRSVEDGCCWLAARMLISFFSFYIFTSAAAQQRYIYCDALAHMSERARSR